MTAIGEERCRVAAIAREWLGTRFVHGQAVRGAGVDCAQLLLAVYADAGVVAQVTPDRYTAEWYVHERRERLLEIVASVCVPVSVPALGDVAVFHYGRAVAHGAVVVETMEPDAVMVVHADRLVGRVQLERCGPGDELRNRLAGFWSPQRWHPVMDRAA